MQTTKYTHKDLIYIQRFIGDADETHYDLLIFALHFMTGDAYAMQFLFEGLERSARLIFPQGMYTLPESVGNGFAWFPDEDDFYNQRTEAEQAPDIRIAADKVANLIQHVKADFKGKIIVVGMSQGGDITTHLAAYYPDLIDVAIPMAGRLSAVMRPANINVQKLPAVHILTGDQDQYVPIDSVREVKNWLAAQGYAVRMKEYRGVRHEIPDEATTDLQEILCAI
jgi:predicted esterase